MIIAASFLFLAAAAETPVAPAAVVAPVAIKAKPPRELTPEQESDMGLAKVRRIYVDILSGGESAIQIRDLFISTIQATKLFIVTDDEDKADAVLKGAGQDQVFKDVFQSAEGINAHSQVSIGSGSNSNQKYSNRTYANMSVGENENRKTEERKHEAIATVHLVNKDGDVIWSATEESLGAKFMGASVDVVTRITKRLATDYQRAKAASK